MLLRSLSKSKKNINNVTSPIQAFDYIQFEQEFEKNPVYCARDPDTIAPVPSPIKKSIIMNYTVSSIGTGTGITLGIVTRFSTPIAFGGGGFAMSAALLIGLTAGAGIIGLIIAYFVHKYHTKKILKETGKLIQQNNDCENEIPLKAEEIKRKISDSFEMLIKMLMRLQNLSREREKRNKNEYSEPSEYEKKMVVRIQNYIDFLVKSPIHPNLQLIKDKTKREEAIERINIRQFNIKKRLREACQVILSDNSITIQKYITDNHTDIRQLCYPDLELKASKKKIPTVIAKPAVILGFIGGFSGTMGLCYSALTVLTTCFSISIAFPPLFAILAIAAISATAIAYNLYKIEKFKAKQTTKLQNQQKHISFYQRICKHLDEKYTEENTNLFDDVSESMIYYQNKKEKTQTFQLDSKPSLKEPLSPLNFSSNGFLFLRQKGNNKPHYTTQSPGPEIENLDFTDTEIQDEKTTLAKRICGAR